MEQIAINILTLVLGLIVGKAKPTRKRRAQK